MKRLVTANDLNDLEAYYGAATSTLKGRLALYRSALDAVKKSTRELAAKKFRVFHTEVDQGKGDQEWHVLWTTREKIPAEADDYFQSLAKCFKDAGFRLKPLRSGLIEYEGQSGVSNKLKVRILMDVIEPKTAGAYVKLRASFKLDFSSFV